MRPCAWGAPTLVTAFPLKRKEAGAPSGAALDRTGSPRNRPAAVLLASSVAAFLLAFPLPIFLFVHWAANLGAHALLIRTPHWRRTAIVSTSVAAVLVAFGLAATGIGVGPLTYSPQDGRWGALGTTLAVVSGPASIAVLLAGARSRRVRLAARAALVLFVAAFASWPLLSGIGFIVPMLLALALVVAALGMAAPLLARGRAG